MENFEIDDLIKKYTSGICTEQEKAALETWYLKRNLSEVCAPHALEQQNDLKDIWETLKVETEFSPKQPVKLWSRFAVAASILICIGVVFYFYQKNQITITEITAKHDIAPGGNKAFLTLADGKRITLADAKIGALAEQSGVKITKAADGQLIYNVSNLSKENNKINAYNTIETPRGGTYQVRLPDGTKVWLNAASTIKYPVSFTSRQARRILLLGGEAYFEVAKDKKHPFIVQTDKQEVEVLGTHFNINSYSDEKSVKTTLLEGSVSISPLFKNPKKGASKILKPDEQAVFDGENLKIIYIDADEAIAWKQGLFKFEDADVKAVFRQLSRWYDMDIVYENDVKSYRFTGEISKSLNLSEALSGLQFIGLKFKVEGKRIVVANK